MVAAADGARPFVLSQAKGEHAGGAHVIKVGPYLPGTSAPVGARCFRRIGFRLAAQNPAALARLQPVGARGPP